MTTGTITATHDELRLIRMGLSRLPGQTQDVRDLNARVLTAILCLELRDNIAAALSE